MGVYKAIKIFDQLNESPRLEMDRTSYLKKQVRDKSVLHIGCADYPMTEDRLRNNSLLHKNIIDEVKYVLGIDNSPEGIKILHRQKFKNIICMDAENLNLDMKFDTIIAGDVLEHMNNPGKLLEQVNGLLEPFGSLIVGVPNAYSFNVFKFLLGKIEPTHKDHCFFFSPKTLVELCSRYNLSPAKLVFTVQPKNEYSSRQLLIARKILVSLYRKMSPSFIMHFQNTKDINMEKYFLWR